jgi:hypothetical protein
MPYTRASGSRGGKRNTPAQTAARRRNMAKALAAFLDRHSGGTKYKTKLPPAPLPANMRLIIYEHSTGDN